MTAPGAFVKVRVDAWRCTCQRCGHEWLTLEDRRPSYCAGCKRRNWWELAGVLRPGRKPKKATGKTK